MGIDTTGRKRYIYLKVTDIDTVSNEHYFSILDYILSDGNATTFAHAISPFLLANGSEPPPYDLLNTCALLHKSSISLAVLQPS